jgi:membrane protein DedA with SNARE-associated domain
LTHLVHQYGLALVFVVVALQALCVPLPGTTALIAAALYAANSHGLPIAGVIIAAALGATLGGSAAFAIGRWRGETLLLALARPLRQRPERVQALRTELAEHGTPWLFIGRFISGVRNVLGVLAGASGMPVRRFLPVTLAAAIAWALLNGLEYYYVGHALLNADTWVQIVLLVLGLAWTAFTVRMLRRRALRRLRT